MISAGEAFNPTANLTYMGTGQGDLLNFYNSATNQVVTMTPDAASALANNGQITNAPTVGQSAVQPTAPGAAAPGTAALDKMASIQGAQLAMSIGSAVTSIATSIIGYCSAKDQIAFQQEYTESAMDQQMDMQNVQAEAALDQAKFAEMKIDDQAEGQKDFNIANEERVGAENMLAIAKARKKESEKTSACKKSHAKDYDKLFRNSYHHGSPAF